MFFLWVIFTARCTIVQSAVLLSARLSVVLALIMSRVDFCNALFAGLPASTIVPLQRVQNAAARLVLQLGPRDHISQGLQVHEWAPLVTDTCKSPLQTLYSDAWSSQRQITGVHQRHCHSMLFSFAIWSPLSVSQVHQATAVYEVRRTGFFLRRPTRMEPTSWRS